jgi:RNA polymerase sigma factor (sigma-70 family)
LALKFPDAQHQGQLDDIVQEVLTDILSKPTVLTRAHQQHGGHFRYYLMRVAYNAGRNARRRLRTRQTQPLVDDQAQAADDDPDIDRAWATSILEQAWQDLHGWAEQGLLSDEAMLIAQRHLGGGEPLRQIADDLTLSLTTCHRRLAQARTLLQQAVADHLCACGEIDDHASVSASYHALLAHLHGGAA